MFENRAHDIQRVNRSLCVFNGGAFSKIRGAPERPTDLARVLYAAEIALKNLPGGNYLLEVTVSDRIAKTSASQEITFHIE